MGEVGTALADDESVIFYNPAGLAIDNPRWKGGAGVFFTGPLLPAFSLYDLWHTHIAACYQSPFSTLGGFGFDFNYINMGINEFTNELGQPVARAYSYEMVCALSWGTDLFDTRRHFTGINLKWIYSALAPGIGPNGEGTAQGYAIDIGYLLQIFRPLRLGLTAMNMGPAVFYISRENADPIPFTLNCALAYKDSAWFNRTSPIFDWAMELRIFREFVKNHHHSRPDPFWKALWTSIRDDPFREEVGEITAAGGIELTVLETISFRQGLLYDYTGERYELHLGCGMKVIDHAQIDFHYIYSPEGFMKQFLQSFNPAKTGSTGVRDGQWGFTLTLLNIGWWEQDDFMR
jgi:hypothetical protein